ncbi:hypothetical protein CDL15_Pgr027206 [Punica granatum]|uniref:Rab3GAP catalytic subunit conserved domain-containing protein n=1 Tax=Punica granatum TaxID=22663 RepID=A0A218WBY2_PUNGR|nr:hypothetical protein CDL15_Pgr027206 [Punica granatum]
MERRKSDRNRHGDRERIPSILLLMLLLEAEDEGYVAVGEGEGGSEVETVEGGFLSRKSGYEWDVTSALNLARDIHAAPPGSFVVKVAEVIGSFKTMKKMALFWNALYSLRIFSKKQRNSFFTLAGYVLNGSQLLSDMQSFKAGCILEDFVRWHSPPDWTEAEECETDCFDSLSTKGQLSRRMQKEGLSLYPTSPLVLKNRTAKPVPAVKQSPLFDEDLAVEGILNFLEDVPPLELFGQLFVSLLGAGLGIAEFSLSAERGLSMLFYECKEYVLVASQGNISEKVDDLCRVYETVEMMLLKPEDVLKMMKQAEVTVTTPASGELKSRFKRLILNFGSKNRGSKDLELKNQRKSSDDNLTRQSFTSFFDRKSSLFSKKPPKPLGVSPVEKSSTPDDNEWTLV